MSAKNKKSKNYLSFTSILNKGKSTSKYLVSNVEHKVSIGEIKWHGAWRKYCFFPYKETLFDAKCLAEIALFLDGLMKLRNNDKTKANGKEEETKADLAAVKSGV